MPPIKLTQIISYSSQDENNPADNLLKPDSYLKWKCKPGNNDKNHQVIVKLDRLSLIHSIDIGNEHSAFVEVLVGREGMDFQVLLVASSFMTPLESRNSKNISRVRMFGPDKLNKNVAEQKWDRIKVICTQPFNKHVQYGLAFIHLHSKEANTKIQSAPSDVNIKETKLGKFTLRESDLEDDPMHIGSLFNKRKESPVSPAAIRATSQTISSPKSESPLAKNLKRKINDDQESSSSRKHSKSLPLKEKKNDSGAPEKTKILPSVSSTKQNVITKKSKPFKKLMEDVVFVLSGYQNPKRSQLRDKLLEMGAKYKGDWDKTCTHLICAYTNTPKFQAVKGKGKIVGEKWIEGCYTRKMRLPWRRYNLEKNKNAEESEDEIWASEEIQQQNIESLSEEKEYALSEIDTDDEIQEALNSKVDKIKNISENSYLNGTLISDDDYDADTDVDEENEIIKKDTSALPLPTLPDYFNGKVFFIYGKQPISKENAIKRYITTAKGKISSYMNESINFVITDESWDDNFDDALEENASLQFVKPQWIWKCYDKKKCLPPQPFLVSCANS